MPLCFYCKREHDPTKYCQIVATEVIKAGKRPDYDKFRAMTTPDHEAEA